ncbi:hypothetical protein I4U23_028606 [Adineta vaga]|nr:hypothetical protein I4U23_028606 [Adineta vaga]
MENQSDKHEITKMNTEEVQVNILSASNKRICKLYSPWSIRVHPLVFIPYWVILFALTITIFHGLINFINTTNNPTRLLCYIFMFIMVLVLLPLMIIRIVEYLIDMKTLYLDNNRSSNLTDIEYERLSLIYIIKPYLQKFKNFIFLKFKYVYKQNENIVSGINIV